MDKKSEANTNHSKALLLIQNAGMTTLFHPVEYVKVLIQIGHEPIRPYAARTLFGRPALKLPGVFKYISHIKSVDGFFGLYKGLLPRVCGNVICAFTYEDIIQRLPDFLEPPVEEEEDEEQMSDERKIRLFLQRTVQQMVASCLATIVSYPLHVVAVRTMAQFVGKEDYGGVFGHISHIIKEEGSKGFFAGLIPRLLGDVCTIWLAHVATFIINTYIVQDKGARQYIATGASFLARTVTYPFTLVSTVMTVNNCGLAAGVPPSSIIYVNWKDCWSHLSSQGQLKRGSSILWRYYTGPVMLDSLGRPTPVDSRMFKSPRNA